MIGRALGNLALAVAAVAVTLLLGELASRVLFPEWVPDQAERTFWAYDETLGWVNQPGRRGTHRQPDFAVQVEISSQGLRDREYPEARVPGKRRMLVLGDSFAWGYGVERPDIWHERIEARHPDWELINTGVAGYGTGQQLLYFERRGFAFHPDVVLLLLHPNDFLDNNEPFRYGYFKPTYVLRGDALELTQVPVPRLDWEARFDRYLRFHTYLLYRLYHIGEVVEAWREARAAERERPAEPTKEERAERKRKRAELSDEERAERRRRRAERREEREAAAAREPAHRSKYAVDLDLTLRLLVELRDRVAREGARFLVVSVPMPDPPRSEFAARVARAGIPLLLLDDALEGAPEPIRYPNDPHWTPYGHRLAADAVEAFLAEQGVLGSDGARSPGASPSVPDDADR